MVLGLHTDIIVSQFSEVSSYLTVILSNLETKEVKFYKVRVYNTAAIVIQSKWRSWIASENLIDCIICVIELQCLVRKYLASKYLRQLKSEELMDRVGTNTEESASAIIICQSIARRWLASFRLAKTVASAVLIQAQWRTVVAIQQFSLARHSATVIQSQARQRFAVRYLSDLKQKHLLICAAAATKISTSWRGYKCHHDFERAASGKFNSIRGLFST